MNLSNNEMRHPRIVALHRQALSELTPAAANTYPDLIRYRARFAELLDVDEWQLLMSAGSDNAYLAVLGSLVAPGGMVLTQEHNYSQLFGYAKVLGLQVQTVELRPSTGDFNLERLQELARELGPGDLLTISNPNGPLGCWWSERDVLDLARRAGERGAVTLIDEAYAAFGPGGVFGAPELPRGCVVVESMSKSFGLAGARMAFLRCADEDCYQRLMAWNVTNPVSQLTMDLAAALLARSEEIRAIREELTAARRVIAAAALDLGLSAPTSEGNFQVVGLGSERAAARCVDGFAEADIAIRDLHRFGVPGAVRITACVERDLDAVLHVAKEAFAIG